MMIVNNVIYQIFMEIPLDMILKIMLVIFFINILVFGLLFGVNSAKELLKSLFHKYVFIIGVVIIIWSMIIYLLFGSYLTKYYSNEVILLTIIFSTSILCFTSYKWSEEDSFLKNMIKDNFKVNTLFGVMMGLIPLLFGWDLEKICFEFFKSLILPIILEILFLPIIYLIAVLNEYFRIFNILPILSNEISIKQVFKKYNISLKSLHKFNEQLIYKLSNKKEVKLINSGESEFKLENNEIYMGDEIIGKYECDVKIPKIKGKMSEAYTKKAKIHYILGDWELENFPENMSFVYFTYKNTPVKLFIMQDISPMHVWSTLIEDIYEFGLL